MSTHGLVCAVECSPRGLTDSEFDRAREIVDGVDITSRLRPRCITSLEYEVFAAG